MMSLLEILSLRGGGVISIVGAGGKTTLMFALAHEIAAAGETGGNTGNNNTGDASALSYEEARRLGLAPKDESPK